MSQHCLVHLASSWVSLIFWVRNPLLLCPSIASYPYPHWLYLATQAIGFVDFSGSSLELQSLTGSWYLHGKFGIKIFLLQRATNPCMSYPTALDNDIVPHCQDEYKGAHTDEMPGSELDM